MLWCRVPRWALALVSLASATLLVLALERDAPLFVNLGAGDAAFARGFRPGWERDGKTGSGETMFHWAMDGSRLELPLDIVADRLTLRVRVARFADTPAEVVAVSGGRELFRWTQPARGWSVREFDLGEWRGPFSLTLRTEAPEGLAVALDWVELRGAATVMPQASGLAGLLALLLGVPLVAGGLWRRLDAALLALTGLLAIAVTAVLLDRLGGLLALANAGPPAVLGAAALGALVRLLRWAWPDLFLSPTHGLAVALAAALTALVALSQPFFYYPDVGTHARYLAALRADPYLAWDARDFQARTGAWTRDVGGVRVAFPYSPAFHLLAWPLARVFGEVMAVKLLAVLAFGSTLVLAHALAAGLGLEATMLAQALAALLPVFSSRLTLALFPALLGQALELLLLVHLLRRFPHLEGARDAGAAALVLAFAQAAYTGSLINVAALVLVFAAGQVLAGERLRVVRLILAYLVAAALIVALQYGRFLPVLLQQVLPQAVARPAGEAAEPTGPLLLALARLGQFYGVVLPLLVPLGWLALRSAARSARLALGAPLVAGTVLLLGRYQWPALLRDVKEVELLAVPVAVAAAAGLTWLWRRRRIGQIATLLAGGWIVAFGVSRAIAAYGERFLAVGR